jgi:hypothetical protein
MRVLDLLTGALKTSARVVKLGAGLQEKTRKQLVTDLNRICGKCQTAFDTVLVRLKPVKNSARNSKRLAIALRQFAADSATRKAFKPEHLCGEVDSILVSLESNLNPLKYSLDVTRLREIRGQLLQVGNADAAIYQSYDDLTRELDNLASEILGGTSELAKRTEYARHIISAFEDDLRAALRGVREARDMILHGRTKASAATGRR